MVCSLLLIAAFTNYSISMLVLVIELTSVLLICILPRAVWTSALAYMLPFVTVVSIVRAGCVLPACLELRHPVLSELITFTPQPDDFPLGQL